MIQRQQQEQMIQNKTVDAAFLAGAAAFRKFKDKWERTKVRAIFINPSPHLRKAVSDSSPSQIGEFFHGRQTNKLG